MMCLLAMMAAGTSAKAQQITITLMPGWNWISYTNAVTMDIDEALGDFEPFHGDRLKNSEFSTEYDSEWGWFGDLETFEPGQGYMYYSARTEATSFVFVQAPSSLVTTGTPTDITITSAVVTSTLNLNEGNHVFARGVCWDTVPNPTIDGSHIAGDNTASSQSYTLDGLSMGATYYVRAYVAMDYGLVYGEQKVFSTRDGIPVLTTADITDMGTSQVTCGGEVTDDGGLEVTARGVCWSTSPNPTIADAHTTDGAGMGEFVSTLTGLEHNTTYYVRAYATNSHTTSYGEEVTFIIDFVLATVATDEASWVTTTTAIVGGQFSYVGNCVVTEWGICYRTEGGTETCVADSTNANPFTMELTGLLPNTTYIVRAYAINRAGTAYGEEKTFTTLEEPPAFPNGAIDGKFTVNAYNGQVYFSQGNLQYIGSAAEPYWKFADYQWEYLGDNGQTSDSPTIDRDLFRWGTSGYDHGANCYQPWSNSQTASDYYAYGDMAYNLYDQTGQADWGYNAISNGGNEENSGWRTLTGDEWQYVIFDRITPSGIRFAPANVNGVNGLILLPDNWNDSIYALNNTNVFSGSSAVFSSNTISAYDWVNSLETNGAVFLPAAGRLETEYNNDDNFRIYYWSSSSYSERSAYNFQNQTGSGYNLIIDPDGYRYYARSIRLVQNAAPVSPSVTTYSVTGITNTTATVRGQITDFGGAMATEFGICYRTEQGAETCVVASATNYNVFLASLEGLIPNTTYYVRAYATNEVGTSYGEEMSFTTLEDMPAIVGYIDGLFTVNEDGGQVYFSQGNLQYIGSVGIGDENNSGAYWKFADNQWDHLNVEAEASDSPTIDRDLFRWGTSGYNHGAVCYQPWSKTSNNSDYYAYGIDACNLYDMNGKADWGYNAILNGGNQEGMWRSMTEAEWQYVLFDRSTPSGIRFAPATVNDAGGIILLPDDWNTSYYTLNNTNNNASYDSNIISADDWQNTLEANGAVFLPGTGRTGAYDSRVYIWTSSMSGSSTAYCVFTSGNTIYLNSDGDRYIARAVRLVRNAVINLPTVTTLNVISISNTGAVVRGQIAGNGGATVTSRGICYRTEQGEETCVASDAITNTFSVTLEELTPNTTYYVRTYATNEAGTSYGEEVSFTTLEEAPTIIGYIDGLYTIDAEGSQVYFSQGNLQYIGSAGNGDENNTGAYWKFADNQWDHFDVGVEASDSPTIDRDLFRWGTSGYNHGAVAYRPWNTNYNNSDYYAYGSYNYNLYDQDGTADWGYNAIVNGGNQERQWRSMSGDEWQHVLFYRSTASGIRFAPAKVNGVGGIILLPDDWNASYYSLNSTNNPGASYNSNIISADDWLSMLEANGAVFLPGTGRTGNYDSSVHIWTSSWTNSNSAHCVYTSGGYLSVDNDGYRRNGRAVRLVRNAAIAPPTVTTHSVMGVTSTTAIVGGQITDFGGVAVTEYGICYRTEQGEETCVTANGINDNTFWKNLQDLTPNTTYIVRAYATNDEGTGYGEEVTFTTLDEGNEHEYVDLGLPSGLLWATCNVGADTPEEYGDYFAWGETTPKDVYSWSTYLYSNGNSSTPTKYTESDGLTILQPEDDAATANWGNGWRMPTKEEWQELYQRTTHVWTTQNGVHGRLFTGSNGNSIFLPAAGSYDGSSLTEGGVCGSYWASSLRIPQFAWDFYFGSGHSYMGMGGTRFYGESVRAVRDAE